MSGKSRIVRPVDAGRPSCCNQRGFRGEKTDHFLLDTVSEGPGNSAAFLIPEKIYDINIVVHGNIRQLSDRVRQKRLEVLPVNLDVPVAAAHVLTVLILQNHQSELLHLRSHLIEILTHRQQQILPRNAVRILQRVVHIKLWRVAFRNIRVQCVDTRSEASASPDICLLRNHNPELRIPIRQSKRGITARGTASDNQYICIDSFNLHLILLCVCAIPLSAILLFIFSMIR